MGLWAISIVTLLITLHEPPSRVESRNGALKGGSPLHHTVLAVAVAIIGASCRAGISDRGTAEQNFVIVEKHFTSLWVLKPNKE